ncbi:MAG TPA: TonB-dependent receptor [Gemmatimonadaceae bacterium]|jgi:hypothetical protein|nr:TonB-dependent receptor [Gemmatimonadaceae bacterium]
MFATMRLLFMAVLVLSATHASLAQTAAPPGRIEGTITDSVYVAPLAGATLHAMRAGAEPESALVSTTDRRGHFEFARVPAGRYSVTFTSAMLDSLEYGGPVAEVTVAAGKSVQVTLAVPSSATLRAAACPGVSFQPGTGALLGVVSDADTERPLAGAEVVVAWTELSVDSVKRTFASKEHSARAKVDEVGQYRLCGLPAGESLLMQVQHGGRAGSALRASIGEAGVLVRKLSFSSTGARRLAADVDPDAELLAGSASVAGAVRDAGGASVVGAQVRVLGTAPSVRTDGDGRFLLGGLPAGTHELEVRHLGFGFVRRPVELRGGGVALTEVQLERVVSLDSVSVIVRRLRYPEFESRRRWSVDGKFLDQEEIERRHPTSMSHLVAMLPGFVVQENGGPAIVMNLRSSGLGGLCPVNIVIDGIQGQNINDVQPSEVGAIESYPRGGGPLQYKDWCGMIVIWTKR